MCARSKLIAAAEDEGALNGEADQAEQAVDEHFGEKNVPVRVAGERPDKEITEAGDSGDQEVIAQERGLDRAAAVENKALVEGEVDQRAESPLARCR